MSRRDLCQPSFVDAMVSGYGKVGGFLGRIDKAFAWPAFDPRRTRLSAACDVQDSACSAVAYAHRSGGGGGGAGPVVVPPFLRPAARGGDARHTSIWRFRQTIDKLGLSAALLLETNRQLDGLGPL